MLPYITHQVIVAPAAATGSEFFPQVLERIVFQKVFVEHRSANGQPCTTVDIGDNPGFQQWMGFVAHSGGVKGSVTFAPVRALS